MTKVVERRGRLDVWTAPFKIPDNLLKAVSRVEMDYDLRRDSGVDPIILCWEKNRSVDDCPRMGKVAGLVCDGYCCWHSDGHMATQFSALLVLRNDTGAWVEGKGCQVVRSQPVGALVWLDLWRKHRLNQVKGRHGKRGVYVAACLNLERMCSRVEVEDMYRSILE